MNRLVLAALALATLAAPAAAQTDAGLFVTGGVFAGIERGSHVEVIQPVRQEVDLGGTVIGGSAGVGTFVHPAWSVRLELAVPGTLEDEFDPFDLGRGLSRGPRTVSTLRTLSGSVLVGHHVALAARVSLGLLGGVVIARRIERMLFDDFIILPPGPIVPGLPLPLPLPRVPNEIERRTYHAGAGMGLDLDWAAMDRVILVPQMRIHVIAGELSLRPGFGVRVNF